MVDRVISKKFDAPCAGLESMRCLWLKSPCFTRIHNPRATLIIRRVSGTAASPLILRPYQEHCLDTCIEALASGASRIGVSLPTGSGKTTVFISLLSRITPPASNPAAVRSLIVVNSVELARQSAEQVTRLFPSWTVEIEQGSKHKATGLADV